MAVKLRLMRMGKKKQPTYRVVAADSRSPRDGRFIEILGTYEPRAEPSVIKIDNDKAVQWLSKGAQPTETVEKLLKICGAWEQFKAERHEPRTDAGWSDETTTTRTTRTTSSTTTTTATGVDDDEATGVGPASRVLEYVAKAIVDDPDSVVIEAEDDRRGVNPAPARGARRHGQGHRPPRPRGPGHPHRRAGRRRGRAHRSVRRHRRLIDVGGGAGRQAPRPAG